MLPTHLATLLGEDLPGVADARDLVAGFDDALVHGLGRLGEQRAAALVALTGAAAATPLGDQVAEAVDKVCAGSVTDEHLTVLAGVRTALSGAVHDALLAHFDAALGRSRASWDQQAAPAPPAEAENLLSGCRSWLTELAIAGWRGVDHDLAAAASQPLEALLARPELRRLAVLLDGLAAELRVSCPVAAMEHVPAQRWGDLWTRALLLSHAGGWPVEPAPEAVSGRLLVLGVDIHEHSTAVQVQVHAILEPAGGAAPRLVRTSVAAAKTDTIVGAAMWRLFGRYPVLLGALTKRCTLEITDLPLRVSGDLVWHDDQARPGEVADPFATARLQLAGALAPAVPPLDRHPVRIAEPVLLEGYEVAAGEGGAVTFALEDRTVAVAVDRLPTCGPLTPELVTASAACIGLVRWDAGRWLVQPLAVQAKAKGKGKSKSVHNGDWAADPKAAKGKTGDPVAVLRERAGRLLRK